MSEKQEISDEQIAEYVREGRGKKWLMARYVLGAKRYRRVRDELARKGMSPEHGLTREAAPGFVLKGHSDFVDETTGELTRRWYKYDADKQAQYEQMIAAAAAMSEELPRVPPLPAPASTSASLCNLYTLTDAHVGMLAWGKEGGDDWDLRIAEDTLVRVFAAMIESAPPARDAVVCQLGDFLHFDGLDAVTPTHGHLLDADGRYSKVVETAIRILRRIIDLALHRHQNVRVVMAEGNHDLAGSIWLRKMFKALYELEPRVSVDDSELPFYVYQHGEVMLCFHHGHLKRNESLPLFFAAQHSEIWGATRHRYAHTGHRHHREEKEHSGMTVTQHRTLAARDAHASRHGYLADRSCTCITYHRRLGDVGSATWRPEMLEPALDEDAA